MRKPLISLTLWTLALGAAAAVACSAPDPGVGYLRPVQANTNSPTADSGTPSSNPGTGSGSGSVSPPSGGWPDAGTTSPAKADSGSGSDSGGASEAGPTAGGFLGETTPWVAAPVGQSAIQHHTAVGQAAQTPTTPCLSCHQTGGVAAAFLAAGFVATSKGGTTGAVDVEVRLYAQGGTAAGYNAHTDADGFFWINPPTGGTAGPYTAGARDGKTTHLMVSPAGKDCQTCHAGATGVIYLP